MKIRLSYRIFVGAGNRLLTTQTLLHICHGPVARTYFGWLWNGAFNKISNDVFKLRVQTFFLDEGLTCRGTPKWLSSARATRRSARSAVFYFHDCSSRKFSFSFSFSLWIVWNYNSYTLEIRQSTVIVVIVVIVVVLRLHGTFVYPLRFCRHHDGYYEKSGLYVTKNILPIWRSVQVLENTSPITIMNFNKYSF